MAGRPGRTRTEAKIERGGTPAPARRAGAIRIEFDRHDRTYHAGKPLEGHLVVDLHGKETCRSIRLMRFWRTGGRGNEDYGGRSLVELHQGPLRGRSPHRIPFSVEAPFGPFSYQGALLTVNHYLEARLDLVSGVGAVTTERFDLEAGAAPFPPDPELITVTGSRARGGAGCRIGLGALLLLFGFLTLPLGAVLMGIGVLLLFPVVRRGVAGTKLGEVTSHVGDPLVQPGGSVQVEVKMDPLKRRSINGVKAVLRGREVSVAGRDREKKVHQHEIHSRTMTLSGPRTVAAGEATVLTARLPVPDMNAWTFSSEHNEVTWDLTVHVDIPSWPDWYEEHKLILWPWGPARRNRIPPAEGKRTAPAPATHERADRRLDQRHELERELAGLLQALPPAAPAEAANEDGPEPSALASEEESPPPRTVAARPDEPSVPGLAAAVRAILEAPSLGGTRDRLVRALTGENFTFDLEAGRIQRTFGAGPDPTFRDGRTVTGVIAGTDVRVAVRFPTTRNPEIDALARGSVLEVTGTVIDWEKLSGHPMISASVADG